MKRYLIVQLSVSIIALMTLCSTSCSTSSVYGKYIYDQNPSDYTELKSDKTFFVQQTTMSVHGTFEIDGTNLTLNPSSGGVWHGTIDGNKISDGDGMHWNKNSSQRPATATNSAMTPALQFKIKAAGLLTRGRLVRYQ
jgi:hypothetical protein